MRKTYLFIVAVTFITVACKKNITDLNSLKAPASGVPENYIINPCYGNTWATSDNYLPSVSVPVLTYNNKAYVVKWVNYPVAVKTVHIYDGSNWQTINSNIPYWTNHPATFAFTIGSKGYIGWGSHQNFYEYDLLTNTWTQLADFPVERHGVSVFVIGTKGYVMGGTYSENGTTYSSSDTWEYNPGTDAWTQKADFSWLAFTETTGFSIGNKGYLVNGKHDISGPDVYLNILLEYDPVQDKWSTKSAFPGEPRSQTAVFVISGYAYAGGGTEKNGVQTYYHDFYKYNPVTGAWTQIPDMPGTAEIWYAAYSNTAFCINSKGYVANGGGSGPMQRYTPRTCPPVSSGRTSAN